MAPTLGSILLVDDEPRVLESLTRNLRGHAYRVLTAGSGNEALTTLALHRVDVVVSDHQMPGMTGVELLSAIARDFPGIARLLLTGNMTLPVALSAVNQGQVHRLLLKPCPPDELIASIGDGLARAQLASATERLLDAARAYRSREVVASRFSDSATQSQPPGERGAISVRAECAEAFSKREKEVLGLLVGGRRPAEIASLLFVSPHTVRNHLKAMFRKAGVHSQRALMDLTKRVR
jgi:DNA-binding NarL/FixJ family response regulator